MTIQQQNMTAALIGHMEVSNNNVTLGAFWSISIIFLSFLNLIQVGLDSLVWRTVARHFDSKKSKLSLLMVSREVQKNDIKKIKKADALGRSCS